MTGMRELSLHILDLVENSLRAGAGVVCIRIAVDSAADRLHLHITDNGTGLQVEPDAALDPFYTTKSGKRTGLGLSLMRGAAEAAGGGLELSAGPGGPGAGPGVTVAAWMGLHHVDRAPLGDLSGTLASLVCTNPGVDFRLELAIDGRMRTVSSRTVANELGSEADLLTVAGSMRAQVDAALRRSLLHDECGVNR